MKQKIRNKKQGTKNGWRVVAACAAVLLFVAPAEAWANENLKRRLADVTGLFAEKPAGYEEIFAPVFRKAVPEAKLKPVLVDYFKKGGKVLRTLRVKKLSPTAAEYRVFTKKGTFPMKLGVEAKPPHRVNYFWVGVLAPRFSSLKQGVAALKKLPGTVSFSAWKLGNKRHKVLARLNANKALAIGSTFKLYILGALVADARAGKRSWSDVAKLSEARRSWPSGVLQKWPEGAPVTLHTLASQMISISDNTATDELLLHLGRERVEQMLGPMGNKHSRRNKPFLSTREMFRIKEQGKGRTAAYLAAKGPKGKRAYLEQLAKVPWTRELDFDAAKPNAVDTVEWFASASDLCRAMAWLRKNTSDKATAPARGVLGINRGLQWPRQTWPYVGYKGGSEPGVLNLTWLAKRKDGAWFALSAGWNNPEANLDDDKFIELVQGIILLLEK